LGKIFTGVAKIRRRDPNAFMDGQIFAVEILSNVFGVTSLAFLGVF
jgi:hypothetical protein